MDALTIQPWVTRLDRLTQHALAPGAAAGLASRIGALIGAGLPDGPVLDVGCGHVSPLAKLRLPYIGIDRDTLRTRIHAAGATAIAADAAALPFADASCSAAFSFGLLHHLDAAKARRAIAEMRRVVRSDGLVAVFDGLLPDAPWRRPLAFLVRALDRGHFMRDERTLRSLFENPSGWHYERVTYARTGLEGLWCVRRASK